jgi:glycosyltransferase involved in cell wall biosynthesis
VDALFLAGLDWEQFAPQIAALAGRPIINLIQNVRHADPDDPRHLSLSRRAVRICISEEVAEAVRNTGRAEGPLVTIPIGLDWSLLPPALPPEERPAEVGIFALKQPDLGRQVAERLAAHPGGVRLYTRNLPRPEYLRELSRTRIAVFLPNPNEGVYLPPLEGMALDCLVVCAQGRGTRHHCVDGVNCLKPEREAGAIAAAVQAALQMSPEESARMRREGLNTVGHHKLENERARFLHLLNNLEWGSRPMPSPRPAASVLARLWKR